MAPPALVLGVSLSGSSLQSHGMVRVTIFEGAAGMVGWIMSCIFVDLTAEMRI
jgi:hypothetical protein